MQIDYSEHFDCADKLSRHFMQDHHKQMQAEAEIMQRTGKGTMSCDLSKRKSKHGN